MKVFISDLHLGDGGPADNFKDNEKAFIDFIDYLSSQKEIERLVINGDLFFANKVNFLISLKIYEELFNKLAKLPFPITYLVGNHDKQLLDLAKQRILDNCEGLFEKIQLHYEDDTVWAEHGQRFDKTMSGQFNALADLSFLSIGFLERDVDPDLISNLMFNKRVALKNIINWLTQGYKLKNKILFQTGFVLSAKALANEKRYLENGTRLEQTVEAKLRSEQIEKQVIILAHDHKPYVKEYNNKIFVNTGSWVCDINSNREKICPRTYVAEAKNKIQLLKWENNNGVLLGEAICNGDTWSVSKSHEDNSQKPLKF